MSDKKNIDRLFQEKLKDFEATPSDSVWDKISSELHDNRKDEKRIPIWWQVAGVAAALLLLFTISQLIQNDDATTPSKETIVDIDTKENSISEELIDDSNNEAIGTENDNITNDITNNSSNLPSSNSTIIPNKTKLHNNNSKENKKKLIANTNNQNNYRNNSNIDKEELIPTSDQVKTVAADNTNSNLSKEKNQNNSIDKEKIDAILNAKINALEPSEETAKKENADLAKADVDPEENTIEKEDANAIIDEEKLSIDDAIAANEEKTIEDIPEEEKIERWKVASNIAPVYFNTFGKGSSIHPQFNNNSKTGNINMSYGISGSYAINKKLSVRAGVSKVNLGYSTNNVVVFNNISPNSNTQLLRNVELTEEGQNLSFISATEFNFIEVPNVLSNVIESSIDQKLGFIEIPLELEYKISSKKVGVNLIGGFSALLLSDNEIYSVLEGKSTLLGKAININNTSFSANFGVGFDFKMSDKINLNLEPVFKYQLNTFNDTSGDFKPFFIGVYSGLSFKF